MTSKRPSVTQPLPGPKAKAIIERDSRVTSPSYIKEYPLVVERGEGPWIYDVDGNSYLDFMAGIAVASTGHAHPKVVAAIQESSKHFLHICSTDFYYETFAALCEKLASYIPKMGKKKVFLTNSGTEAVEGAIKLARYHTKRTNFVAFKNAFHGRTTGAIALTSSKAKQRAHFGPFMPGVTHIPYSNPYRCDYGHEKDWCGKNCECATRLETDWFKRHFNPEDIAAIFVEPVQGEGGFITPSKKFLVDLRRICDEHGILLVFDEIQSGVGRTGEMYAAEYFDVAPDILLSAKGLGSGMPIGAIIAKESVMTWPSGSHGSTYGGNPVCCAAALATLEVVEELLPSVKENGEIMIAGLRKLQKKYPVIGEIRGMGFMIGCEFADPKTKAPLAELMGNLEQLAFTKGLLLLGCGSSTIRFAPPLVISKEEIETGLEILDSCLGELTT